jgi:hypothetical protein
MNRKPILATADLAAAVRGVLRRVQTARRQALALAAAVLAAVVAALGLSTAPTHAQTVTSQFSDSYITGDVVAVRAPSLSSCILQEHEAYVTSAINPSFHVCYRLYPKQMHEQIKRDMRKP